MVIDTDTEEGKAALQKLIDADTKGLKDKNTELLGDQKKLKKDMEALQSQMDEINKAKEDAEAAAAAKSGDVTKITAALEAKHKKEREDDAKKLADKDASLHKLLVDNGLTDALTKAGVTNPAHLKAAKAMILAENKAEVGDVDGTLTASIGGKPITDFVSAFAQGEDGKHFVAAPINGGGGAGGSNGGGKATTVKSNMGGTPAEREAAIQAKFTDLPK